MSRIIVHPPMIECVHCGGDEFAVPLRVSGVVLERHDMRTGEIAGNEGMWDDAIVKPLARLRNVICSTCMTPIGRLLGYAESKKRPDERVDDRARALRRRTIRIVTLVLFENGRMVLVKKRGQDFLILPGGKPEPGEREEAALRREVREELGCRAVALKRVGVFKDAAGGESDTDVEVVVYVGRLHGTPSPQAEIESIHRIDLENPEMPVAPSLANLIFPYFLAMQAMEREGR